MTTSRKLYWLAAGYAVGAALVLGFELWSGHGGWVIEGIRGVYWWVWG